MTGMDRRLPLCAAVCLAAAGAGERAARAGSHPEGVTYPLRAAALAPSGLAQPLPSTRRYVLVWPDQLVPDGAGGGAPYSQALMQWVVTHFVGTQKLFRSQIDSYRALNPNFLVLTYHLAFGLNGADQKNPVGNITGPNQFGQEDTDTFTPWVAAHGATREDAYQHSATPASSANRVSYPDPYWLMDIAAPEWRSYVEATLLAWAAFPSANSTGFFLDVAFPPWYNYAPSGWWAGPAGGASRQDLDAWWMPRATDYFNALRTAFAPSASHPRYLVVPNPDALDDGTDEPTFLEGADGVFTENWQKALVDPTDWNLSVRRICHYVTGHQKVWMMDSTSDVTTMTDAQRSVIIGTYLLIRNGTSYAMLLPGLHWYPEYEIDLGGYVDEPPDDIEQLRVAGAGGSAGGLYARQEVSGTVLVNSSSAALTYDVPSPMEQAEWSGGGAVGADGSPSTQTLTYSKDVPAGPLLVPAQSAVVLRSPAGPPAPGIEPGAASDDAGTTGPEGGSAMTDAAPPAIEAGAVAAGGDGAAAVDGAGTSGDGGSGAVREGGCACRTVAGPSRQGCVTMALVMLVALWRRRR
ncbi:MAG TPA: putative glycoside hydrolase [Polyangiaceae bacterium]|nr:putative glycoside hydrolase [Polyangiaceae bacterium]